MSGFLLVLLTCTTHLTNDHNIDLSDSEFSKNIYSVKFMLKKKSLINTEI